MADAPVIVNRHKWILFAVVAVLSLAADQGTKIWARSSLPVQNFHDPAKACVVPDDTEQLKD